MILLLFGVFAGCENPFTTRQPEPPTNPSNFIPPSTPDIVFINLRIAFEERNVENYIRSFVDTTRSENTFIFVPDRGVAAANPGTFQNWQLLDERRYVTQLLQVTPADSIHTLRFVEEQRNEGATTATFTQNYELILHHQRQNENIPIEYRGQSQFSLEKNESGDWVIYRWEDFTNGEDPPWSELKVLFQ
ncbi:hypothetical protein GWN42_17195 [candidate division KSB1 bacterium]|nr:hypothetical protein [candidate division KSB1 bacterium]NIR73127.1 hypothetical protein [candidate division KSB1 bacterium]NIS27862.1 hypothetical protein [candidate division KSB1 bacterium]NIU28527.1 hypothetical protein [candidate division KSB1 bacterium]NIU91938.1 hypothetical protein [candidate division KSB1 bacterium]